MIYHMPTCKANARACLVASALIVLFAFAVAIAMQQRGVASRQYVAQAYPGQLPRPVIVERMTELYPIWKGSNIHGRVVVHMGRFLHFGAIDENELYQSNGRFPTDVHDQMPFFEGRAKMENLLWLAMRGGLARSVYYVMPGESFAMRQEALRGVPLVEVRREAITMDEHGSMRRIVRALDALPQGEPLVLNVDASYMAQASPQQVASMLKSSPRAFDMLTLCMATDNPDVTPADRDALRELARLLDER